MTEENIQAPSRDVVMALAAVMAELPAIGKDERAAAAQGGYSYRGIDQITRHVQPLLAKHGVVFAPSVESWEVIDIVVGGKPWTDTRALISYTVYGPGGLADCIKVGPIPAIGRDNSDKGANKCMTQAFKYALLQVLCVADAKDDADGTTHEADPGYSGPPLASDTEVSTFLAMVKATDSDVVRQAMNEWYQEHKPEGQPTIAWLDSGHAEFARLKAEILSVAPEGGAAPETPESAAEGPQTASEEVDRYAGFKKADLIGACAVRHLAETGSVAELLERLRESDVAVIDRPTAEWDCVNDECRLAAAVIRDGVPYCPDHETF